VKWNIEEPILVLGANVKLNDISMIEDAMVVGRPIRKKWIWK